MPFQSPTPFVGVSHITVHGRTRRQTSSEPVSLSSIAFAVQASKGEVPVVANGDAWDLESVSHIRKETRVRGVMAARGLLANPVWTLDLSWSSFDDFFERLYSLVRHRHLRKRSRSVQFRSCAGRTRLNRRQQFVDISSGYGLVFPLFHRHLCVALSSPLDCSL